MAQFLTIPSLSKSEISSKDSLQNSVIPPAIFDDEFIPEEIKAAPKPSLPQWLPKCEYRQIDIDSLVPGPSFVSFRGRVVNLYRQQRSSQMPKGVEGCWRLIVKDDTAAVLVILVVYSIR